MSRGRNSGLAGRTCTVILLAVSTIFLFSGFRGCGELWFEVYALLHSVTYGGITWGDNQHRQVSYGISVGANGSIFTQDGGPTYPWIESTSPTSEDLNCVKVYDDSTVAVAVGNSGTVIRSRDKGISWQDVSIPSVGDDLYGLDFLHYWDAGLFVVVCGDNGTVYRSTGSGESWTWEQLNTPTTHNLKSIGAITTDLFIAVGDGGTIIRTGDSGQTWDDLSVADPNAHFKKVQVSTFYPNFDRAWAVGDNGVIYASTDYGFSWFPQSSGTDNDLHDLSFRSSDEGIVVGENGTVRYTTDGGSTWLEDPFLGGLTTDHFMSVARVDSNTATAIIVDSLGALFRPAATTSMLTVSSELVGIGEGHSPLPAMVSVFQNHPNPFYPVTTISIDIEGSLGSSQRVSLTIHDLQGRHVRTVVNTDFSPGTHMVLWDGRDDRGEPVSSGTYLYCLRTGRETITRRMMLLR